MRGFSLIELMVVIAIVAVLAAVAVPAYQTYVIKVKVSDSFRMLKGLQLAIIEEYNKNGYFPASVTALGTTFTDGIRSQVNMGNIKNASFHANPTGVYIGATLTGLSAIPGFVEPTGTNESSKAVIRMAFYLDSSSVFRTFCGIWSNGDPNDVPVAYTPENCTCGNMNAAYNNNPAYLQSIGCF